MFPSLTGRKFSVIWLALAIGMFAGNASASGFSQSHFRVRRMICDLTGDSVCISWVMAQRLVHDELFGGTDFLLSVSGDPAAMDVDGYGAGLGELRQGTPLVFTLVNGGDQASGPLSISINGTNPGNFAFADNQCLNDYASGLPIGQDCTFSVLPQASENLSYAANIRISGGVGTGGTLNQAVSGVSINFPSANIFGITWYSGAPDALNVNGEGHAVGDVVVGDAMTFEISNTGSYSTGPVAVSLSGDTGNFTITLNGCDGISLAPDDVCDVQVTSQATENGDYSAMLSVVADPGGTVLQSLSGTAEGFPYEVEFAGFFAGLDANYMDPVVLTVTNNTIYDSVSTPVIMFSNPNNFEAIDNPDAENPCSELASLEAGESCTFTVRGKLWSGDGEGTYSTGVGVFYELDWSRPATPVDIVADVSESGGNSFTVTTPVPTRPRDFMYDGDWYGGYYQTFRITNNDTYPTDAAPLVMLSNPANFELSGPNTCASGTLAAGASCTFSVRSRAFTGNGSASYSTGLGVFYHMNRPVPPAGYVDTIADVSESSNNFALATPAVARTFDFFEDGAWYGGYYQTYRITNSSSYPTVGAPIVMLSNTTQFEVSGPNTCSGGSLAAGASCTFSVRERAWMGNGSASYSTGVGIFYALDEPADSTTRPDVALVADGNVNVTDLGVSGLHYQGIWATGTGQTFVIANSSGAVKNITGPTVSPDTNYELDAGETDCGASLANGATCNVAVRPKASQNGGLGPSTLSITLVD